MFRITQGRGFQMVFDNGYTISVQWGAGYYCGNNFGKDGEDSITAEVGIFETHSPYKIVPINGQSHAAYLQPEQVAELIAKVERGDIVEGFNI